MTIVDFSNNVEDILEAKVDCYPLICKNTNRKVPFAVWKLSNMVISSKDGSISGDVSLKVVHSDYDKLLAKIDSIVAAFKDYSEYANISIEADEEYFVGDVKLKITQ